MIMLNDHARMIMLYDHARKSDHARILNILLTQKKSGKEKEKNKIIDLANQKQALQRTELNPTVSMIY